MKKLKSFAKFLSFLAVLGAIFVGLFLQEWGLFGSSFRDACLEKGVRLPLEEPKLVVNVKNKTLSVFDGDVLITRYDIATGKNAVPGLIKKGSDSTPLGEYRIRRKAIRESVFRRGSRFMELDFPTQDDIDDAYERRLVNDNQYEAAMEAIRQDKSLPPEFPLNGPIGIQGNDFVFMGDRFTDGSIAMSNADINDLFEYIPVGTPVIIKP